VKSTKITDSGKWAPSRAWVVVDAVPANQSRPREKIFPGISQFIRELPAFSAFLPTLMLRKPLLARVNLGQPRKIP
jgi:hypothetical protein